ncbi:septation ring formation regulator EzrA [Limosilactobacillus difficilis]|uniref:septation ring formation regulator EzrA n=1 Tax=Limosilactobacillus difficilis TaxID=2991838 RepID=UPI0024B96C75|nr:septation ring formation regulator EzrA [Limosilactobacillus difficilis]
MFQVVVGVLVLVIIILVVIYVMQRRALTTIRQAKHLHEQLATQKIDEELAKLDEMELSGDSKKEAERLHQQYDQQVKDSLQAVRKQVVQLESNLHGIRVFTIGKQLSDLQQAASKINQTAARIKLQIKQIRDQQTAQQEAVASLNKELQTADNKLEDDGYLYGDSLSALEKQLTTLKADYQSFVQLVHSGDYAAAEQNLSQLQTSLATFQDLLKKIPPLYKPLLTVYPDQLKELAGGYQQLHEQGYHFVEEAIDQKVDRLQEQLTLAKQQLNRLELTDVAHTNQELTKQIEHYYDIMQRELDARPHVHDALKKWGQHLEHAHKQNDTLLDLLNRLSQSYTLNHDEMAHTRELDEQLQQLADEYHQTTAAVNGKEAVDSQVLAQAKQAKATLDQIESQQEKLNDQVATMRDDERRTRKAVTKFVTKIRTIKRRVENLNLPGIDKSYMDYFFLVSDEISRLDKDINKPKINMDDITKQLLMVQSDLQTLEDKTDDLRDSAELTGRLIQYANRLAEQNAAVAKAIDESQQLYSKYQYQEALEKIATALEVAEPGAYKRLEDGYYRDINGEG